MPRVMSMSRWMRKAVKSIPQCFSACLHIKISGAYVALDIVTRWQETLQWCCSLGKVFNAQILDWNSTCLLLGSRFFTSTFLLTWALKVYALNCWEDTSLLVPLSVWYRNKIDGKLPALLNRDEALVFICVHVFVQAHALLASQKMKVFLIGAENMEKNITQCSQEERKTLSGTQFRRYLFWPPL